MVNVQRSSGAELSTSESILFCFLHLSSYKVVFKCKESSNANGHRLYLFHRLISKAKLRCGNRYYMGHPISCYSLQFLGRAADRIFEQFSQGLSLESHFCVEKHSKEKFPVGKQIHNFLGTIVLGFSVSWLVFHLRWLLLWKGS